MNNLERLIIALRLCHLLLKWAPCAHLARSIISLKIFQLFLVGLNGLSALSVNALSFLEVGTSILISHICDSQTILSHGFK